MGLNYVRNRGYLQKPLARPALPAVKRERRVYGAPPDPSKVRRAGIQKQIDVWARPGYGDDPVLAAAEGRRR